MTDSVNKPAHAPRDLTRPVHVGNVQVGGGAPVSVQSMCTTKTDDAAATLAQIGRLAEAGCEIVRVAIPRAEVLDGFQEICGSSPIPVVADIHFDHKLAIEAARRGAAALRVNPGNIGSWERVDAVIDAAGEAGIPIRIGVNAGSLDKDIDAREDLTQPQKLVQSAVSFVRHFEERGFSDIVMSAKVHDVPATIETNRELSRLLPHVPLHIGVTEAGTFVQGTVKNVAALSVLLSEGIGDTMRLSLTADPVEEVKVAWELLAALGMRRRHPELVSCPTCGRCQVNMIPIAEEVSRRLQDVNAPISVAVMGCAVNGPGEAKGADIGMASGNGQALLFANGEPIRKVPESSMVDELFSEIEQRFGNREP
ncbi:flavodoxin-dependent (E)-4-hydroxy-3-methylbut-2-enyl-diphosphate synthase [Paratractidigestivibacter sp.]|uniref:flavodoxin-dependent (E)-4-hydroxy-3-methylbut-2-enyl-diphosphate synthase n=1 Tax=Paratractidigestivibacter sp. TaxID=2847316 RepID=UPI002ABDD678|nr:flavodoxin-dependent (E)-4-hydroxy-3-methylbut-2-enyl-diphosphate synthase [Paratractidigestivibacter sp.]